VLSSLAMDDSDETDEDGEVGFSGLLYDDVSEMQDIEQEKWVLDMTLIIWAIFT